MHTHRLPRIPKNRYNPKVESATWICLGSLLLLAFLTKSDPEDPNFGYRAFSPWTTQIVLNNYVLLFVSLAGFTAISLWTFRNRGFALQLSSAAFAMITLRLWLAICQIVADMNWEKSITSFVVVASVMIAVNVGILGLGEVAERKLPSFDRMVTLACILFVLLNFVEFLYKSDAVLNKGRLYGVSLHPNEFGISCSIFAVFLLPKLLLGGRRMYSALGPFLALLVGVVLSGSRSAGIAFLLPALFLLHKMRSQQTAFRFALAFVPIVGIFIYRIIVLAQVEFGSARIIADTDTRSEGFMEMLEVCLNNPLFGMASASGGTSNSFLYAGASAGVLGAALATSVFGLLICSDLPRLLRIARHEIGMANVMPYQIAGSIVACMLAALLSGYLLETIQFPLAFLLCIIAASGRIR